MALEAALIIVPITKISKLSKAADLVDDLNGYTRNADGTITGPGNFGGQRGVFRETGELDANGNPILQRESGGYFSVDPDGKQTRIASADLPDSLRNGGEAPWQESQGYVQGQVDAREKSYLNGEQVPHGTPGSVRPDAVPGCGTQCFEVKNYDLSNASGINSLVNATVQQIIDRAKHLPDGMQQKIWIDITGQDVSDLTQVQIKRRIIESSDGAVKESDINFFERD